MSLQHLHFSTELNRPAHQVFQWHERPGALARLTPPWQKIEILRTANGVKDGEQVRMRQKFGPLRLEWEVEHFGYVEDKEFSDRALKGPFSYWQHRHSVVADGAARCTWHDELSYKLPAGALGELLAGGKVRRELNRMFHFRQRQLRDDQAMAQRYGAVRPMRFLIAGASGLIGTAMIPFLQSQGHEVVRLVRQNPTKENEVFWDPEAGQLDEHQLKAIDVVINLAGVNVAQRWTKDAREKIWNSRVAGTRTLVDAIERLKHRPFVLISASGTGVYGSRGDDLLSESSERGSGFLADLCDAWEREVYAIEELGIRPVAMRTGVVLTPAGGALARLGKIFSAGLGGKIGDGRQWMSWISIDDVVGAYYHAVLNQRCIHEVNAVAPNPVTNAEFTATLARVLRRPKVFSVPRPMLRAAYGQMADEALLSSARVLPEKLTECGYLFRQAELEDALRFVLGR